MAKSINWAAIKKRYLQGDKPKDIAADFGLTAKQVSDRATKQGWRRKKAQIGVKVEEKIEKAVEAEIDKLDEVFGGLILSFGEDLAEARRLGIMGLTIQDAEAFVNPLARDAVKTGLEIYKERQKHKLSQPKEPEKKDSGPVDGLAQTEIMDRIKKITGE